MPLRKMVNRLRETRRAKGFSGFDLELLSRIPAQDLYRIERGLRKPLPYEKNLLSNCLGVAEDELFPESMDQNGEIIRY